MDISDKEKKVLEYFFTNTDSDVFAAKNFHPEVWALMQARYSRARDGLRESFLSLLKEDAENFELMAEAISDSDSSGKMQHASDKAIKFMEKWVLGYGHSSVAEGAVVGIGLEGVSILATKVIEDNRLCSYCEKSTRYVSFDEDSFFIDKKLLDSEHSEKVTSLVKKLFRTYKDLHDPVLEYVKKAAPCPEGTPKPAWERATAARRFDAIRYLLPAGTRTSLGWTVNARQLAHAIRKLLSHPLKEMQDLGKKVKEEASKVLPSLLKYADENPYFTETEKAMNAVAAKMDLGADDGDVSLAEGPDDADDVIISAILYRYLNTSFARIRSKVRSMEHEEKEKILDEFLSRMGKFDAPLRELEHIQFTFDIVMDYGAFRDLQRHRICTQTSPILTTDLGYEIPQDIIDAGVEDKYREAMDAAAEVYDLLKDEFLYEAQYIVPLGYKKRFLITMNLREAYHFIKLRSSEQGHESYRVIACKMDAILKSRYPLLTKYLECDYSNLSLGRLKAEERTEKKMREKNV